MRRIEIALGSLIVLAVLASVSGLAGRLMAVPALGMSSAVMLLALGGVLVANGFSRATVSDGLSAERVLTWRRVSAILAALAVLASVPVLVQPLNLMTAAGFPIGFLHAAAGAGVALILIAFRAAGRLDAAEEELSIFSDRGSSS